MEASGRRNLVVQMIAHGMVAGGLRKAARDFPDAERGLVKAAEFHSGRVVALAAAMLAGRVVEAPRAQS